MANLVQDSQDKQVIYKLWVITMIIILDHSSNKTRLLAATSVSMKSLTKNLSLKYVSCQKSSSMFTYYYDKSPTYHNGPLYKAKDSQTPIKSRETLE